MAVKHGLYGQQGRAMLDTLFWKLLFGESDLGTVVTRPLLVHIFGILWAMAVQMSGVLCQNHVSRARKNNYIPQLLWGEITYPSPWYLLTPHKIVYLCHFSDIWHVALYRGHVIVLARYRVKFLPSCQQCAGSQFRFCSVSCCIG